MRLHQCTGQLGCQLLVRGHLQLLSPDKARNNLLVSIEVATHTIGHKVSSLGINLFTVDLKFIATHLVLAVQVIGM